MIYLHKILPVLLLPTGAGLLLILVGVSTRKRWPCWAGVFVLWSCSTPWVGGRIMVAVEGPDVQSAVSDLPKADAIVALTGGLYQPVGQGIPQWSEALINRFEAGVELYLAGKAPALLYTNGWLPWRSCVEAIEPSLMALAEARGVPKGALLTTSRVQNTEEEARAAAEQLLQEKARPERTILLVTSAFHMRRARLHFEQAGFTVVPFPTDFKVCRYQPLSILDFTPSAEGLMLTETALREIYGFWYYNIFG